MPRTRPPYPKEFRRDAVGLVRAGRGVKDVAESLGVSEQSLRNWVKQDQLNRRLGRGIHVSKKRVERLMREAQISGLVRRRRRGTTIRVPGVRVADDLVQRGFRPPAPNALWCADITYLKTWQGRCYLAAVQDLYSRRIAGWQLAEHMRAELVVDALQMAIHQRRPEPGLIHHSDQGSQFVSLAFGQAARDAGIAVSMGSRGDCFDNAVAESFFSTLKKELIRREGPFATRSDLRLAVFDYIEAFSTAPGATAPSTTTPQNSTRRSIPLNLKKNRTNPRPSTKTGALHTQPRSASPRVCSLRSSGGRPTSSAGGSTYHGMSGGHGDAWTTLQPRTSSPRRADAAFRQPREQARGPRRSWRPSQGSSPSGDHRAPGCGAG